MPAGRISAACGGESFRRLTRAGNNELICQDALKTYGRTPNREQAREFAENKIPEDIDSYKKTGETNYIEPEKIKALIHSDD